MGRVTRHGDPTNKENISSESNPSPSLDSPKWKKPNDIVRLRLRKRKKSLTTTAVLSTDGNASQCHGQPLQIINDNQTQISTQHQARNPFKISQIESSDQVAKKVDQQPSLFVAIDHLQQESSHNRDAESCTKELFVNQHSNLAQGLSEANSSTTIPVDWSLKLSCRFVCDIPLQWCKNITSSDDIMGLTNFVRCRDESELYHGQKNLAMLLKQSLLTWCHPVLPGIDTFPRTGKRPSKLSQSGPVITNEQMLKAMMSDWKESFYSIYHLTRCQSCPYFYLCTYQFNMLFLAAGINGASNITVIISSTTSGFRELITNEGIQFELPYKKYKENESYDQNEDNLVISDDEFDTKGITDSINQNDDDDDESNLDWLKSRGIDNTFKNVACPLIISANDMNDGQKASAVKIEGSSNVHAFYNFLLNYKNLVAPIGWQAGIPPTILSPVAFCGGILKPLTFKCNKVKQRNILGKTEEKFNLEICGPIIPCQFIRLCNILNSIQGNNMTASIKSLESTSIFNINTESVMDSDNSNLLDDQNLMTTNLRENCGLSESMLKRLMCGNNLNGKSIKILRMINSNCHWSTT